MNIEHAWAAGFWDGEGCVSVSHKGKHSSPRIVVQIAQVDRRVLDRFQAAVGYGNVLGPYTHKNKNAQPYYIWRVEGVPHLNKIRDILSPYLGEVKLAQIDKALEERRVWEETATCDKGHRLSRSPKGHWRCAECQSEQGKKNATARWEAWNNCWVNKHIRATGHYRNWWTVATGDCCVCGATNETHPDG